MNKLKIIQIVSVPAYEDDEGEFHYPGFFGLSDEGGVYHYHYDGTWNQCVNDEGQK